MTIEHLWYALVGVYFFWLTVCAAALTALAFGAYRTLKRYLQS